jgi:hypothetical protein
MYAAPPIIGAVRTVAAAPTGCGASVVGPAPAGRIAGAVACAAGGPGC